MKAGSADKNGGTQHAACAVFLSSQYMISGCDAIMLAAVSKKATTAKAVDRVLYHKRSTFVALARNSRASTAPATRSSCCELDGFFTKDTSGCRRCFSSASSAAAVASNDATGNSNRDNLPQPSSTTEQLPTKLIDFETQAKIEGEESHVAMVQLRPGEILRAEAGAMLFMTEGVVSEYSLC